ncbi:MAG: GNAT family N-acetyltransferase [Aquiluna sp.]|nr:GNAT family N-acetyltransferase [Aquiluna sp.]MCF8545629.1 GNAT family N-acetyltransferase [Aquiluna sp.]
MVGTQPLSQNHNLESFDSGSEALDLWLKNKAGIAELTGTARTFVLLMGSEVVGFYSLAAGVVLRSSLPKPLRSGMPNFPVPVTLLARLAVSKYYQGQGIGRALVSDAFQRSLVAREQIGSLGMMVEASAADVITFYESIGFVRSVNFDRLLFMPFPG